MLTFSVVIPVYNDVRRICLAIDALSRQEYPRECFELIIADNGSTDGTIQAIERACGTGGISMRIVSETRVKSSYAARNAGAACAKNDVLAFTDSDCIPDSLWLKTADEQMRNQNAACGGGAISFFFKGEVPNIFELYDSARKLNQKDYVEKQGFAATANFFVRRDVFDRYRGFRNDLVSGGDYEFGRRITKAGEKMIYMPGSIVRHPARSTFKEIIRKTVRVAFGEKQIALLGLPDAPLFSWRSFKPVIRWKAPSNTLTKEPSAWQKAQLIVMANVCRCVNYWIRLK